MRLLYRCKNLLHQNSCLLYTECLRTRSVTLHFNHSKTILDLIQRKKLRIFSRKQCEFVFMARKITRFHIQKHILVTVSSFSVLTHQIFCLLCLTLHACTLLFPKLLLYRFSYFSFFANHSFCSSLRSLLFLRFI